VTARVSPRTLPIEALEPDRKQPRQRFDGDVLQQLAESIRTYGVIEPLVVSPNGPGRWRIVAGERRWRASQLAGLREVPVWVRDTPEADRFEIALVENVQRVDLDPIEEGRAYQQLLDVKSYTQEELARRVGKDRSTIANAVRLLRLPVKVQELMHAGKLQMGHARALLGLESPAEMMEVASWIVAQGKSVRAAEAEVRRRVRDARRKPEAPPDDDTSRRRVIVADLEQRLRRTLGTKVSLQPSGDGKGPGSITIHYASLDELDRLLRHLMPEDGA
jgi:ParB family chromosome partitioning protein